MQSDYALPFLLFAFGLVVAQQVQAARRARERKHQLKALAHRLGFAFTDSSKRTTENDLSHFSVLGKNNGAVCNNVLIASRGSYELRFMDIHFRSSSNSKLKATVLVVCGLADDFPAFQMHPEIIWYSVKDLFTSADIDLQAHPNFSNAYYLTGANKASIAELFEGQIATFFDLEQGWVVQCSQQRLLIFKDGHWAALGAYEANMQRLLAVARLFVDVPER